MPATHYPSSSRGPVEIASMPYLYALNARDKLTREKGDPDVIKALADHVASIEATFEESE